MKYKTEVFAYTPFLLAFFSAYFRRMWLVPITVLLMFFLVAVLPFCRRRENLWLFVIWAACSVPINLFLMREYPQWKILLYNEDSMILSILSTLEMMLICTGIEEILIALIGRKIWRRQYVLFIPESE